MADCDGEIADPEMEVRKLQDLVRKLELQNDILRAKQSKMTIATPSPQHTSHTDSDLEVLNIDNINTNENEETWLYESPKQLTPEQKKQSPYQWVREPFDLSSNASVKKSLLFKLDEIVLNKKLSPSSPGQSRYVSTPYRDGSPISENDAYESPGYGIPSIKKPLTASRFNRVNTDTFTRPKKNRSNNIMKYDWEGPISLDNHSVSPTMVDLNENKQESDQLHHIQEEKKVLDVHILAKMQEESLRQSFSPLNSRRKLSRGGRNGGFYLSRDNDNSPSSNHSSPGHENELPPPRRIGRANSQNSVSSSSLNSNGSSTGASPPESVDIPHSEPVAESRLSTPRNKLRPNQSDPNLLHQINSRTITRSAGRQSPQYREGSPNQLRQPTQIMRAVSPPSRLTGIPTPGRSAIPKPGSSPRNASGLPTPRRSSLPVSRNRGHDESWKDGCY